MAASSSNDLLYISCLLLWLLHLKGIVLGDVFTALVRPLQALIHDGTALWASSCRFLNWLWCVLSWRITITPPKTTLWGSSLCPSQAYGEVPYRSPPCTHYSLYHGMLQCNVCNFPSQGIDMFIYWRLMVPAYPPPRSSSMSKWPAGGFQAKLCRSVWPWPKAKHDVHQIRAVFPHNKGLWKMWGEKEGRVLPAALPVQNSSFPMYIDPLPTAGKDTSFIRDEEARQLLAKEWPRAG